ncbi:hypothetical protein Tco_0156472 [Tanacetum coccineum]
MASSGSDRDAKYALSRLLQRGTVVEYHNEFEMLISRVMGKSKFLLTMTRLIEARFEAIVEKEKEYIIKKKAYTILSLQSELATPKVKGSLDADEDIGVDEEKKESVEEVVVSGGKTLGVDEDDPNRVILVLKDGGVEFDDNIDEINLGLRKDERRKKGVVLCPRQLKAEEKKEYWLQQWKTGLRFLGALVFPLFNPGPGSFAHKRIWDPEIKIVFRQHLEGKVVSKEWRMLRPGLEAQFLFLLVFFNASHLNAWHDFAKCLSVRMLGTTLQTPMRNFGLLMELVRNARS